MHKSSQHTCLSDFLSIAQFSTVSIVIHSLSIQVSSATRRGNGRKIQVQVNRPRADFRHHCEFPTSFSRNFAKTRIPDLVAGRVDPSATMSWSTSPINWWHTRLFSCTDRFETQLLSSSIQVEIVAGSWLSVVLILIANFSFVQKWHGR